MAFLVCTTMTKARGPRRAELRRANTLAGAQAHSDSAASHLLTRYAAHVLCATQAGAPMNAALRALILASVFKERSGGAPDSARKFKLRALSELHAAGNDDGDAEVEIKQTSAAGSIRRWARGRRTLSPVGASQRRAGEG